MIFERRSEIDVSLRDNDRIVDVPQYSRSDATSDDARPGVFNIRVIQYVALEVCKLCNNLRREIRCVIPDEDVDDGGMYGFLDAINIPHLHHPP